MSEQIIEVKKLSCKTGQKYLLHDINWQVQEGEKWVVFGENGSGKTTLLSIIAGLKKYTSGTVKLFGEDYISERELEYRKRISFVSTSYYDKIFRNESVLQIILSGKTGTLSLSHQITNADVCSARRIMDFLRISYKKDMPYCMLSKGEQQSTILARALLANPDILLLDEAESGLDLIARLHLQQILKGIAEKKNITMISVTHYPNEISDLFQQCLLLKRGKTFKRGNISDVFSSSVMSDYFEQEVIVEKAAIGYQVTQAKLYSGI